MLSQVAGSAQSTRSAERTKRCIRITAWATRILAFLSIVFCIVAFVTTGGLQFGICMIITAILVIGHCSVYVWMFISNMFYIILFGNSWYFWSTSREIYVDYRDEYYYDEYSSQYRSNYSDSYPNHNIALLDTLFAFTLIITFFLSMLNLYSFCLVYIYGCCFMKEVDMYHSEQGVETAVVMNQQITTVGGGLPVNGLMFTNAAVGGQQPFTSPGSQYPQYQPNTSGPYCMYSPPQQAIGVTSDSVGVTFTSTMATTSGKPVSPPPYAEANLNVKQLL
ncbi:hypothetical protein MAR_034405 [Mya arenaria]|uniref:Uncharacterized protein n=1 Tax=Mya arenaria TaxID=6604 RepID=A0ABY7GBV0_MYAAR|nr:hypothetical protein MAR_034405 [Mya arenaria]